MDNSLYMRMVYERVEHYLANAIQDQKVDNFERIEGSLLVDNLGKLNFRFELPRQLGHDSPLGITVSTIATGIYDADGPHDRLGCLEQIVASLKALLDKESYLDQKGYSGTYYENEVHPLEKMGFKYDVSIETQEDIERVIDDFV